MHRNSQAKTSSRSRSRDRNAIGDPELVAIERAQRDGYLCEEMERYAQGKKMSRSRSSERKAIGVPDLVVMERAQREGNAQLRKKTNASKITLDFTPGVMVPMEGNSFDLEFSRYSSKKASQTPIKTLIDNELSKEIDIRRSSPSLVARLMGLDTLPPVVSKKQKERGNNSQKISSAGLHRKHAAHESYLLVEQQECKDVFEVMEMPKLGNHNNKSFRKEMPSLEQSEIDLKPSNIDLAFAKQKYGDGFLHSREYSDELEDLTPNKDLLMKFLKEPNSLIRKHIQDLKSSPPSPHASHITILKPLKASKSNNESCRRFERNDERRSSLLKGDINFVKQHSCSVPHKLSESSYPGNPKSHPQSTQIVVLKPSMEKAWDTATAVPLSRPPENYRYGLTRQRQNPTSRSSEVHARRRDRHKLSDKGEGMGHREKELREIARDVTKKLITAGSSSSKMAATSKKYRHDWKESSYDMPMMDKLDLESLQWACDQSDDCSDDLITSSYSSVSREARKRLSQRWKMMHQIQGDEPADKESNTLGEMLVSDKELPRTTLNTSNIQNASGEKVGRGEALARWDYPSKKISRSKSLPSSTLVYQSHKSSKRNRVGVSDSSYLQNVFNKSTNDSLARHVGPRSTSVQSLKYCHNKAQFYSGGEDSEMDEREIHVNSQELQSSIHERDTSVVPCMIPDLLGHDGGIFSPQCEDAKFPVIVDDQQQQQSIAGRGHDGGILSPQCEDAKFPVIVDDQQKQQSMKLAVPVSDGEYSGADPKHVTIKETYLDHPQVNLVSSHCDIPESTSPVSSKEDQPSPVSVLDPSPSEEGRSSSECFEKISADLKELRMQLRLLKLESADTDNEDLELIISSDEDIAEDSHSPLQSFENNEDRDFSYLLDVLIDPGVHCTNSNNLSNEYPIGREVFVKLEKKYNPLTSWPRAERKLLFDLITSILADIVSSSRNCCFAWSREGLVEEVWQLVVKQRNDLSLKFEEKIFLEPRWLNLGDDKGIIAKELESMLIDDLMAELLS